MKHIPPTLRARGALAVLAVVCLTLFGTLA
jgi:hypothetical protein